MKSIILSEEEVRGILKGRITHLVRLMTPQPVTFNGCEPMNKEARNGLYWTGGDFIRSPYGYKYDKVWVREPWKAHTAHSCGESGCECSDTDIVYVADGSSKRFYEGDTRIPESWFHDDRTRNGLSMPKWMSRVTLNLDDVIARKLQSFHDFEFEKMGWGQLFGPGCFHRTFDGLWNKRNPKALWESNPYVWLVKLDGFELVKD